MLSTRGDQLSAVCYARVSTLEQAEKNNSLPVQEEKLKSYCDSKGLPQLQTFIDKQSGRNTAKRPEFLKMLEFCRNNHKKISHLIVADLSRLARNVGDQSITIAELAQLGIETVSIDEPMDGASAAGKLLRNILGSMSQFFSDSLSEKTKERMKSAVKAGRFIWVAPVGYMNEKKKSSGSVMKVDPERAPLVRKGFELMASGGYSADDVLRTLTALGLTTRKNKPVPRQTWHAILRNPRLGQIW
jgi:site-specific DNA recombinase